MVALAGVEPRVVVSEGLACAAPPVGPVLLSGYELDSIAYARLERLCTRVVDVVDRTARRGCPVPSAMIAR
jgi:hypothetical protein